MTFSLVAGVRHPFAIGRADMQLCHHGLVCSASSDNCVLIVLSLDYYGRTGKSNVKNVLQ